MGIQGRYIDECNIVYAQNLLVQRYISNGTNWKWNTLLSYVAVIVRKPRTCLIQSWATERVTSILSSKCECNLSELSNPLMSANILLSHYYFTNCIDTTTQQKIHGLFPVTAFRTVCLLNLCVQKLYMKSSRLLH